MVAISPQKKMIGTMRASFSKDNLNQFATDLLLGKGGLEKLPKEITLKKADKWDGKDAAPIDDGYDDL